VSVKSDKNSTWTLPISPDEANVCQRLADPSPIVIVQELLPDKKGLNDKPGLTAGVAWKEKQANNPNRRKGCVAKTLRGL
jgi:hypothetical protein